MRCIETRFRWGSSYRPPEINYNMRCIETKISAIFCNENNDKLQHEMYWNWANWNMNRYPELDKLQHEMYWNRQQDSTSSRRVDKLQHEMYWNFVPKLLTSHQHEINYNMRCIETYYPTFPIRHPLTDKLQHEMYWNKFGISSVISCMVDKLQHEMYWNVTTQGTQLTTVQINYNMRCIETKRSWRSISWWYG